MSVTPTNANLSIIELPVVVKDLFERAHRPLLPEANGPLGLFVRYLRRKPGRGLAVIYSVDEIRSSQRGRNNDPHRSVSLTLDEQALEGPRIRFALAQTKEAALEVSPAGVLQAQELGLSVQSFPADGGLPMLAASCDVTPHSALFHTLEKAAQTQLKDEGWQLVMAKAEPVRYKPGNRCVIRYRLTLAHKAAVQEAEQAEQATMRPLIIFGKVYANKDQAQTVQQLQLQLYNEQQQSGDIPLLPQPLGMIEALGLTFNEAVQPVTTAFQQDHEVWTTLRTGSRALRPSIEHGRNGEIAAIHVPEEELRLTARALARLHTSAVHPSETTPRTGAKEAKRARERAALIAKHTPEKAAEVQSLANQLAERLSALQPEAYRPAHGGFKASQLLFHSHRAFVVDFDGFCLADPALDVGYFLAYLRPSGLWYHSLGMRQWFESAASLFRDTYRQAMLEHAMAEAEVQNILQRARLYEAALIFKIATRRANRLNSPRPQELSTMLQEIASCLSD